MLRIKTSLSLLIVFVAMFGCSQEEPMESGEPVATATSRPSNPAAIVEGETYDPQIDPQDFTNEVDNPFFPLKPGSKWTYEGMTDEGLERIAVEVTDKKKQVMGIDTVVVRDVVTLEGDVIEDTFDWYAQDAEGNVWYMGEDTTAYEDGEEPSKEGSWEAGVDGALPGIQMPADAEIGVVYRQEYLKGEAEDTGEVIELDKQAKTKVETFTDTVITEDINPFEPDVVENKYYARGVGFVLEQKVKGSDERIELVSYEIPK